MYKRNQVESAIERAVTGVRAGHREASVLRVRIKRLTETDRAMGADRRSHDLRERHYAFFDAPPPGRGTEVTYSAFGAFALLLAVRLMAAGLPQSEAVIFIRRIRPGLEQEHGRILARKGKDLLDHKVSGGVEAEVAAGRLVQDLDGMVFLMTLGSQVTVRLDKAGKASGGNIVRGARQLTGLMEHLASWGGSPIICIELVNVAHQLAYWLSRIEPTKRGRK